MTQKEYDLKIAALQRAVEEYKPGSRERAHWERRLANALAPWGRNEETMFACTDERERIWSERIARGTWADEDERRRWVELGEQISAYDRVVRIEKARAEREQKSGES